MWTPDLSRPNACPPAEVLAAYSTGRLPDELLESAAGHLTACAACLETMHRLEGGDDPLVADLRRFVPEESRSRPPQAPPTPPPALPASHAAARVEFATTAVLTPGAAARKAESGRPRLFAGYELLEELGRGGMGHVYRARQTALDREVALKVIAAGPAAGPEARERFRVEARAVARLKHPHVVQIHDFGEADGQPYFSMEVMGGGSLKDRLSGEQHPERESAELVRALAAGVHAAHEQRIVHRDIKPGNVLLDRDGTPKISDFGLAKFLDAENGQTLTDAILGTPAYMAPEQVSGSAKVGPAADIYSLGAILFEMLTGRPPFRGASRMETLDQVRHLPPPPMSRFRPGVAPDLEAVCFRCLEKAPRDRYASAEALADDLGRWLRGEATHARPLSWTDRLLRSVRRHPVWAAVAASLLVAALAAAGVAAHRDPDRQRAAIEREIQKGGKVVLLGETGKPRWSRWRAGGANAQAGLDPVGTFFVSSPFNREDVALLELASSCPRDRYRFEAEVRHNDSATGGQVGLYFAHQAAESKDGLQVYAEVQYNDIESVLEVWNALPREVKAITPPPKGSAVYLASRFYAEQAVPSRCNGAPLFLKNEMFQPAGPHARTWRKIVVEVTPQRVRLQWDGKWALDADPFDMGRSVDDQMPKLLASHPHLFEPKIMPPRFDLRGGLGLYVFRSSASFRNVTVEPLE